MTVTLNIKPELEAGLLAQAQAGGVTLEQYLLSIIEGSALLSPSPSSPSERAAAFKAWAASHKPAPPLSDYAMSRESMYEGRDG